MNSKVIRTAPWLAAGLIGGLIALAPVAAASTTVLADGPTSTAVDPAYPISADTGAPLGAAGTGVDPLVPDGTLPQDPVTFGYINRNHDEGVTANGEVDAPF
jgi:hypothetical protein